MTDRRAEIVASAKSDEVQPIFYTVRPGDGYSHPSRRLSYIVVEPPRGFAEELADRIHRETGLRPGRRIWWMTIDLKNTGIPFSFSIPC